MKVTLHKASRFKALAEAKPSIRLMRSRISYVVKKDGCVKLGEVGWEHSHILRKHKIDRSDATHMGAFQKVAEDSLIHIPTSGRYRRPNVPREVMDEVEKKAKEHMGDIEIVRTH